MPEKIYNYFKGYVTVRIKTRQLERFLNIVVINNIYLWEIRKISCDEMIFNVSVKGFKKLRKIVYEVRGRVKIIKKTGFFIFLKTIKKKRVIFFCTLPAVAALVFFSTLILDIEITGNETTDTQIILEKLKEIDLQKFKFRSNIDSDEISLKLINDLDSISWVGVYEKGTKLLIEIKERKPAPKMVPMDIPCHIVAKKDGIVKKMNVKNGEPLIKLNEVVVKGQPLISGVITTKHDGLRYVHSMADITAETWWEEHLTVKLYEYSKIYTGNFTKKVFLKWYDKEFDLSFGRVIPFYNFEETESKRGWLSSFVTVKKYDEYTLLKTPLSYEEAVRRGKEALLSDLYKAYGKNSVKGMEFEEVRIDEETIDLKITAITEEDIGMELKIERNN